MIGQRLKILREEKGLKQIDIANILGVGRTTYTQYETEKSEPDLATVAKLADFFGVSIDYLLGKTDIRTPKEDELIKSLFGDNPELFELLKRFTEREDLKNILIKLSKLDNKTFHVFTEIFSNLNLENMNFELKEFESLEEADKQIEEYRKNPNYKIMKNEK